MREQQTLLRYHQQLFTVSRLLQPKPHEIKNIMGTLQLAPAGTVFARIGRLTLEPVTLVSGRRHRGATSATRDYARFLMKTSPGARVTAELGLCPDAEVPPRNLGKTEGGQRPIRRCPLLQSK